MECPGEDDLNRLFFYLPIKVKKVSSKLSSDFISDIPVKDYFFPILRAVYLNDGMSQKELTGVLPYDKSRISVVVREMIEAGLITDSADGRSTCLHLTEKGKEANAVGRMYAKLTMNTIFQTFSEEELHSAMEFLLKLDARLDEIIGEKDD